MSWVLKDTINGTKIYQYSTNYATRNGYGSGKMELDKAKGGVMHNPAGGTQGNSGAKQYAESIITKLKNSDYVIMAQASVGTDEVYLIQPLNYSCPHAGDYDWNNTTWGAEVFCESSKAQMEQGHKAFYDLSVYAHQKYGTALGSHKLHQEISATACPAKSVQYFGSIQAVKENINKNSNPNDRRDYNELVLDNTKTKGYYNPNSVYDFKTVRNTYVFKKMSLKNKYPNTEKKEIGYNFKGLKYAGRTTEEDGYTYVWAVGENQYGNKYYIVEYRYKEEK